MQCPTCKRSLLSRMSPLCNWCGARTPEFLLYSEAEKEAIEKDEAEREERLHKIREENRKKTDGGGYDFPYIIPPS